MSLLVTFGPVQAAASALVDSPTHLVATELDSGKKVSLAWGASPGAVKYNIYRSKVQGSYTSANLIYTLVMTTPYISLQYEDSSFASGIYNYYYRVTAVDSQGAESGPSNEVTALPHYPIKWAGTVRAWTVSPESYLGAEFNYDSTLTTRIYGEIFIEGRTGKTEPEPDVWAQFGYAPVPASPHDTVDLTQWTDWRDASDYGTDPLQVNSRYAVSFVPLRKGDFYFTYRFSTTAGREWTYTGVNEPLTPANGGDPTHAPVNLLGLVHVLEDPADTTPPTPPTWAQITPTATSITLTWNPATDEGSGVYFYDIYRVGAAGQPDERLNAEHILATDPLTFPDKNLVGNTSYAYYLTVTDHSFNQSQSEQTNPKTLSHLMTVKLHLSLPRFTQGKIYLNRAIDPVSGLPGAQNWKAIEVTSCANAQVCDFNLTLQENAVYNFSISRGSEATIQTGTDGNAPAINPSFTVTAGTTVVSRVVDNWDDPLVIYYLPVSSKVSPMDCPVVFTWNQAMPPDARFTMQDMGANGSTPGAVVAGSASYDAAAHTVTFLHAGALKANWHYRVTVQNNADLKSPAVSQQVVTTWNFTTDYLYYYMPVILTK